MVQVQSSIDSMSFAFVRQASVCMSTVLKKRAASAKSADQSLGEGQVLGL